MNDRSMRRYTSVSVIFAAIFLAAILPAVGQVDGADTAGSVVAGGGTARPSGISVLNWRDPQYSWIDSVFRHCNDYFSTGNYWTEKFWSPVLDASPDGGTIIINRGRGLMLYDVKTGGAQLAMPGSYEKADWSSDGRYIAAIKYYDQNVSNYYVVYDVRQAEAHEISIPRAAVPVGDIAWLPGDSVIVTGLRFPNNAESGTYAISVTPPYGMKRFDGTTYRNYYENRGFSLATSGGGVVLNTGIYGDSASRRSYPMAGVMDVGDFSRLSPDGHWLATRLWAEIPTDRFIRHPANSLPALGIIDLRQGSPTQYKVYRLFPDYTNSYRNCSEKWNLAGVAWTGDSRAVFHEWVRMSDSTTQIVRRDIETGELTPVSNFLAAP